MNDFKSVTFRHEFKRLLLAVSGGLDSICLAHYFITNQKAFGIEWLGIAHVHHGLREMTADRDAAFVEAFAKAHNVPFFLKKLDGAALKAAEGSLEENARDARYKALVEVAMSAELSAMSDEQSAVSCQQSAMGNEFMSGGKAANINAQSEATSTCQRQDLIPHTCIVTAHHAGDQSETMYMRLRRGTTLAGLRGIQEVREMNKDASLVSSLSSPIYLYRPFLNVTRAELLEYAREHNLEWCEDESNSDVKFARNSIRHHLLPHLENEVPGATAQLCRIAALADKAYAKAMRECENVFEAALCTDIAERRSPNKSGMTSFIALDKKKLNRILQAHKDANLSEMLRLWLAEKGFRFPVDFFYAPKEPAHVKIPVRAVYRKRSILKIRHTVWICEFQDTESATKFVS
jgi:tRNA(Ile)-lysidine synthase